MATRKKWQIGKNGKMAKWQNVKMAKCQDGKMAKCQIGIVAKWQKCVPLESDPQCCSPNFTKSWRMASRSPELISQCRCSLISVGNHGCHVITQHCHVSIDTDLPPGVRLAGNPNRITCQKQKVSHHRHSCWKPIFPYH